MILPFNHNHVIPPYLGTDSSLPGNQSPFKTDIMELCQHFATSKARVDILKGYVEFRMQCVVCGITGFQWIDGSFVENVEMRESRDPHDIDVISFIFNVTPVTIDNIKNKFTEFVDPRQSKYRYSVDHYVVQADSDPMTTINGVKYWNQLFGHNRNGVWKGMLQLPLSNDDSLDTQALNFLNTL